MSVSKKGLQDIYDSGARRLDELEQGQKTSLTDAAEAHLDDRARIEPESLKQLEDRTIELEQEIKGFLARGIERIEKTVQSESEESGHHTSILVDGLVLLTKKFSESIAQLRQLAESQLTDLGSDCHHIFELRAQVSRSELMQDSTACISEFRQEAMQSQQKLTEHLEASWDSIYENESTALDNLAEGFDQNSERISERVNQCRDDVNERMVDQLSQLEARSQSLRAKMSSLVRQVSENAEHFAFDTDVKIKQEFSSLLYEIMASFDDSAARSSSEVVALHESSMADLTMNSHELSSEMNSLGASMLGSAEEKSQEMRDRGNSLVDGYSSELAEKLEASNVFHQSLAGERAQMVSAIWSELSELRQKYEEKIQQLAKSTIAKMTVICEEAESSIATSQQASASECRSQATTKKESIESAASDFLQRIEKTRKAALDTIGRAALGDEDAVTEFSATPDRSDQASLDSGSINANVQADDSAVPGSTGEHDLLSAQESAQSETETAADHSSGKASGKSSANNSGTANELSAVHQTNPRPSDDTDSGAETSSEGGSDTSADASPGINSELGAEPRKRRKSRSDKRSSGDAKQ